MIYEYELTFTSASASGTRPKSKIQCYAPFQFKNLSAVLCTILRRMKMKKDRKFLLL
jgi:hypothetical protein